MVSSCRSWLPKGAVNAAIVERELVEALQTWSEKWFVRGGPRPLGPFTSGSNVAAMRGEGMGWQVLEEGVAFGVADKATGVLAALMLDANLNGTTLTTRDRELLEHVTTVCIDDLRHALTALFGLPADACWQVDPRVDFPMADDAWGCSLGMRDREPLIRLIVEQGAIVAFRKGRIRSHTDPVELGSLTEALEKQCVELSARLGQCEMMLSDLAALNEGDVLILDRKSDALLELAIDRQVKSARCVLEQENEELLLKISKPFSG